MIAKKDLCKILKWKQKYSDTFRMSNVSKTCLYNELYDLKQKKYGNIIVNLFFNKIIIKK